MGGGGEGGGGGVNNGQNNVSETEQKEHVKKVNEDSDKKKAIKGEHDAQFLLNSCCEAKDGKGGGSIPERRRFLNLLSTFSNCF